MVEGLTAYVSRTMALPWSWGRQDCTMWVADWCRERWGRDPALAFRDRYSTEAEADALTAQGLVATISPFLSWLRVTEAPEDGDIGVIEVGGRETAAIRFGGRWAFRTPRGIGEADAQAIIAWGN